MRTPRFPTPTPLFAAGSAGARAAVREQRSRAAGRPAAAAPGHHLRRAAPGRWLLRVGRCMSAAAFLDDPPVATGASVLWPTAAPLLAVCCSHCRVVFSAHLPVILNLNHPALCLCPSPQVWQVISQRRQEGAGGLARLHSALISTGESLRVYSILAQLPDLSRTDQAHLLVCSPLL